ncbi:hypothetical protein EKN56_13020 [Limnobaculum zhutongyuii]|uniref:Uncharacterized protein n=1 Tax=Limnobaculum zhutongyuii TaxID=2498113 RepID=A0A411WM58_9GAMM|nr:MULTISPECIES: hypothetical protein [Limnobaculum]QBH97236.1 hypothetical protein EKN56_13020 [Limnobaculum zhutongyuii]TQS88495.1 hypothetical protein ELQ32_10805 [Limnobaculum zhutongyuii]
MATFNEIKEEALKFRELLENCDKSKTKLVIDCFPVMSCKLSSMLLAYHFLKLWPQLELKGVMAATGKNNEITHYWLEIGEIVIDITGDQYNIISARELNKEIVRNRPFTSVHVSNKKESHLYKLFKIQEKELLVYGFPTIRESFIEKMELGYSQLLNQTKNT